MVPDLLRMDCLSLKLPPVLTAEHIAEEVEEVIRQAKASAAGQKESAAV
jgi:hypothetical protein